VTDGATAAEGPAGGLTDEESRAAMRSFLQRSEVRLSTIHRVAQALLGGSALVLLLPLFLRDAFPKVTTLLAGSLGTPAGRWAAAGLGVAAALCVLLPVAAVYLLIGDLLGFYFTSNTFGSPVAGTHGRVRFNPRFVLPGLGFPNDELSAGTEVLLEEGRGDEWTKSLLVPRTADDDGWRERFDVRMSEMWGLSVPGGPAGDDDRIRQRYRMAGLNRDRTLAHDVARTEALLAKHVLSIRIVVLRYTKALLMVIATTVATLLAAGIIDHAIAVDPTGGRFAAGFPARARFAVALVFALWAPVAARSVTAPLRWVHRHTPGVGAHRDVYADQLTTQFESAVLLGTLVGLGAAGMALVASGAEAGGTAGALAGAAGAAIAGVLWVLALRGCRPTIRQMASAAKLTLTGREAPGTPKRGSDPGRGRLRQPEA